VTRLEPDNFPDIYNRKEKFEINVVDFIEIFYDAYNFLNNPIAENVFKLHLM
jgi:hypothetical protein